MTRLGAVSLLLLVLGTGCGTTRVVRLETGTGEALVHVPREGDEDGAVELEEEEFQAAVVTLARDVRPFEHPLREARSLFGVPERSGVYRYESRGRRLIAQEEEGESGPRLLEGYADEELTREYGRWCERRRQGGDCLGLLEEGPVLASDGKYALAMALAMDGVWGETERALRGMVDARAVQATLVSAMTMYLLLWSLPEPVSKGLAATLTALAVAYLGVDTVWRVLDGWVRLVRRVDEARSFEELEEAGEAYGEVLGESAARVFVMLATAAVGSTAGLAAKGMRLPGSAGAAVWVEGQAGYAYAMVGEVEAVALTAEGFTVGLAPGAVAMAAREGGPRKHHLATNKNSVSTARGGPWTPRFRNLFKKAGMELKDPENIVPVKGHAGPHPEQYHRLVYRELETAMRGCRTVDQCRRSLRAILEKLRREVSTPGTELNLLVTQPSPR